MKKVWTLILTGYVLSGCEIEPDDRSKNGHGRAVFYTTSNAYGQITLTVSKSSFVVPITTNPDRICEMGTTGFIVLTTGSHSYKAVSQNGKMWEGTVIVLDDESSCSKINFN